MNVYDIVTGNIGLSKPYCVVAKNMAEAETAFLKKYWPTTTASIKLHSDNVIVCGDRDNCESEKEDRVTGLDGNVNIMECKIE